MIRILHTYVLRADMRLLLSLFLREIDFEEEGRREKGHCARVVDAKLT